MYKSQLESYKDIVQKAQLVKTYGKVTKVIGLVIEAQGIKASVGEVCEIFVSGGKQKISAEVVGFNKSGTLLMPLGELSGITPGDEVLPKGKKMTIKVGSELLGKVLDGLGRPISGDAKPWGKMEEYSIDNQPLNPLQRKPITQIIQTGVKAMDALLTCGQGQRLGIFAGSGVGKSTLLGMMARNSSADVNVIALIGERGREVLEFIQNDLGSEGLKKSVLIVATSDQPALVRLKGAFVATAIAEYFRDQGKQVMLMMDSITRFAMAQREVGLTIGEPPTTKGYTPSVFALLPKLLERSGSGEYGSITGMYTVLVDGDDLNEPIADAVRGILDGHVVLSRKLASQNHFPAIDIMQSVSRIMPQLVEDEHLQIAGRVRENLSTYEQAEDLINIGAYSKGSNKKIDDSLRYKNAISTFLCQGMKENWPLDTTISSLKTIFKG